MLEIVMSNRFRKDLKVLKKRGCDLNLINEVVDTMAKQEVLPAKYKDHNLTGNYAGFKECHILPDWLLIYRVDNENIYLFLSRSGTHSDLF